MIHPDFVLGAATSAFQIEGGRQLGGRGDSIWDVFAAEGRVPGISLPGCDHFHHWQDDLDLLADLGVSGYRFSVAWPRVIPDGDGDVNEPGVDFYRRLIEGMAERGIDPYLTLYHWDLPQALQEKGGWASRETVDAFARYAGIMADRLGDLVGNWITQNEPWVAAMLGHLEGVFAPGTTDWETALTAGHHLLLSHGRALAEISERLPGSRVGIALDCRPAAPASRSESDVAATRHFDGYRNRWFFDPIFGKGYPDDMVAAYSDRGRLPGGLDGFVEPGDLEIISQPIDFLGLNYYTTTEVSAGSEESESGDVPPGPDPPEGYTEMGWKVDPDGLTSYLGEIHDRYRPTSVLITENGASYSTGPGPDGVIDDQARIAYLDAHVRAIGEAREQGVPVDGYFVWSLLDNLEWTQGYAQRFGLVWVDHETSERTPKASFHWYRDLIQSTTFTSDA